MRHIPKESRLADWPRKVSDAISSIINEVSGLKSATNWALLEDYADDAAAAVGGVEIGGLYRNGSAVMVRVA